MTDMNRYGQLWVMTMNNMITLGNKMNGKQRKAEKSRETDEKLQTFRKRQCISDIRLLHRCDKVLSRSGTPGRGIAVYVTIR